MLHLIRVHWTEEVIFITSQDRAAAAVGSHGGISGNILFQFQAFAFSQKWAK